MNLFNKNLANYEKISQFVVLNTEWTVENNFLTPSMKIKRNTIESAYSKRYRVGIFFRKSNFCRLSFLFLFLAAGNSTLLSISL